MLNQSKVHLLGEPLIAIITSGHAFSVSMIYCLTQKTSYQLNVENKSIWFQLPFFECFILTFVFNRYCLAFMLYFVQ